MDILTKCTPISNCNSIALFQGDQLMSWIMEFLNFAPATMWGYEPDPMSWTGIRVLHIIMVVAVYSMYKQKGQADDS